VFPSIIGGNTNAAVVMIAEKACDLILGRPPLAPEAFAASECLHSSEITPQWSSP
jgi:choline dehydrogenase